MDLKIKLKENDSVEIDLTDLDNIQVNVKRIERVPLEYIDVNLTPFDSSFGFLDSEEYKIKKRYDNAISEIKKLSDMDIITRCLTVKDPRFKFSTVKFIPNDKQIRLLNGLDNFDRLVVKKSRQEGITSILAAKIAIELLKGDKKNINYFVSKIEMGKFVIEKIKNYMGSILYEFGSSYFDANIIDDEHTINFNDNTFKIHSLSSTNDLVSLRLENSWNIYDECAFFGEKVEIDSILSKSFNSSNTFVSTPNGIDNIFFPLYIFNEKYKLKKLDLSYTEEDLKDEYFNKFKYVLSGKTYEKEIKGKFLLSYDEIDELINNLNEEEKFDDIKVIEDNIRKGVIYLYIIEK